MFRLTTRLANVIRSVSTSAPLNFSGEIIGFVGVGNMGGHMAVNLAKKGHPLIIHDINRKCVEMVKKRASDVTVARTSAEVGAVANIVITALSSTQSVKEVYLGEEGLLKTIKKGGLMVDSTTMDPAMCKTVADAASEKGAHYIDAPMSGGVFGARDGTLTFIVGGPECVVQMATPVLQKMGKSIYHCGPQVGTGMAAKLCNNLLLFISMVGAAEALNLGIQFGLDSKVLTKVINASSGQCWSIGGYNPVPGVLPDAPSSHNYEGGFSCIYTVKDLSLIQDFATKLNVPSPFGSLVLNFYRIISNQGLALKDFSSVFRFLREVKE